MRKILITEPIRERHLGIIRGAVKGEFAVEQIPDDNEELLREKIKDAEIVIGHPSMEILQNTKENCPKLRFIQMTWAGTDQYTRSTLPFPKGEIRLCNGSGVYGLEMSQFVVGMILSVMLNFKAYQEQQQKKIWNRLGQIQSLDHAKVLVFGAGNIGTAVAKRLAGFDAYVIGVCRDTSKPRAYFREVCTLDTAEEYLPEVDVVVGCIPNSDQSMGYMNAKRLQMMKQNAVIVNVGRGNFIDCMALDAELKNGHLWGAALDVTYPEPLPQEHPLWENPRCMITPHTSGATFGQLEATEDLLCDLICDNLVRYCKGEELKNRIY